MDLAAIPTIEKIDVAGKRVLVRVDVDVPMSGDEIADDARIRAVLPTIESLVQRNARVILMGHLGEPNGKVTPAFSLEPVAMRIAALLPSGEVFLTDSPVGDGAKRVALDLRDGQVAMLENLRFHIGETRGDEKLARGLAALGDIYVNEAFRVSRHAHTSLTRVPELMEKRSGGRLLVNEVNSINHLLKKIERPYIAVLGGDGIGRKAELIKRLIERVDVLIFGGALANTFNAAKGNRVGQSAVDGDKLALARELLRQAKDARVRVVLPTDVLVTADPDTEETAISAVHEIPDHAMVVDVGPDTRAEFKDAISRANTVVWNGPLGAHRNGRHSEGTFAVARNIAGSAAFSVAIGRETATAVRQSGMEKGFNHVSAGDDAALALLEGAVLPGLVSLAAK